jgi:hypothetical protein
VSRIRLRASEIIAGEPLAWSVYDEKGRLLLRKGQVVESAEQAKRLINRGLFRDHAADGSGGVASSADAPKIEEKFDPFAAIDDAMQSLARLFQSVMAGKPGLQEKFYKLADEILVLTKKDADAVIGAAHLNKSGDTAVVQPLFSACLCAVLSRAMQIEESQVRSIVAAALTCNIASLSYLSALNKQKGALTEAQRTILQKHPEHSRMLLEKAGIKDKIWLDSVVQHHERNDGTGYPKKLKSENICREAKIIAVTDIYLAMTSNRGYRSARKAKEALREIYEDSREEDQKVYVTFIKVLGVYPCGTYVKLASGEIAIVTRSNPKNAMHPEARAVISAKGAVYSGPLKRDCSVADYAVKEMYAPAKPLPLNIKALWGY